MSFSVHGIAVSSGVAIGRAVLVASSRVDVAHYFVDADQTERELNRVRAARDEVVAEICIGFSRPCRTCQARMAMWSWPPCSMCI
jgi:phosphoenolpyruvate-protein kinase (PTS system EI component)